MKGKREKRVGKEEDEKGKDGEKRNLINFLRNSLPRPFLPSLFFPLPFPSPSLLSLSSSLPFSLSPTSRNSTRSGKCMNLQYENRMLCLHSQPAIVSKISRFGLEIAQTLRTLDILAKDLSLIPSTYISFLIATCTSNSRGI